MIDVPSSAQSLRAKHICKENRQPADPRQITGLVFHYSIPAIEATGDGIYQDASDIESNKIAITRESILISRLNPEKSRVLIARPHDVPTVCSTEFVSLSPNDETDVRFVAYVFRSKSTTDLLTSMTRSVTRSHRRVEPDAIKNLVINVPTLDTQRSIADFLDRETAEADSLVAKYERLIELLEEKRAATITHTINYGIDGDASMKESGTDWLGKIPAHWIVTRLKYLASRIVVGIVVNPSEYISVEGLPFIYGGDISEGHVNLTDCRRISDVDSRKNAKTRLQSGDLVTVRVGAPGITAVVPSDAEGGNCASVALIKKSSRFISTWLCYAMNSRLVRYQVETVQYGAAQEQFNISHAVNFVVPTPPIDEQERIARHIDKVSDNVMKLIDAAQRAITLTKEHRSALITAAVTGQIDVNTYRSTKQPAVEATA